MCSLKRKQGSMFKSILPFLLTLKLKNMEKFKKFCKKVLKAYLNSASMYYCTGTFPIRIDH